MSMGAIREVYYDAAFMVVQIMRAAEALHGISATAIAMRAGVANACSSDSPHAPPARILAFDDTLDSVDKQSTREPAGAAARLLRPLPVSEGARLLEAAVSMTGDPLLGLKAGLSTRVRRALGITGVWMTHAPTMQQHLENTVTLLQRTGNACSIGLDRGTRYTTIRVQPRVEHGVYTEQLLDFHIGVATTTSRLYAGRQNHVRALEIPAERIEKVGLDVYEQTLQCIVAATGGHAGPRYATDGLHAALPIDADVFDALAPAMAQELAFLPVGPSLREVVRAVVEQHLARDGSCPRLEAVASTLCMRPRTLQARLRQEGTSLRALRDDARRYLATRWLRQGLSREEVSARLGFGESAAFRRARRRWQFEAREGSS